MSKKNPEQDIWQADHMMVDIETLGGDSKLSPILAIAAMKFNPFEQAVELNTEVFKKKYINDINNGIYYDTLNLNEQFDKGRKIDTSTLKWWVNKPEKAEILHGILDEKDELKASLIHQLIDFSSWVKFVSSKYTYMWAYGNTFDVAFLETLYKDMKCIFPFHYRGLMDARTLCQTYELVSGVNFPLIEDSRSHHALADVHKQIKYVKQAITFLRK